MRFFRWLRLAFIYWRGRRPWSAWWRGARPWSAWSVPKMNAEAWFYVASGGSWCLCLFALAMALLRPDQFLVPEVIVAAAGLGFNVGMVLINLVSRRSLHEAWRLVDESHALVQRVLDVWRAGE